MPAEPTGIALILLTIAVLIAACALLGGASIRVGLPISLVFLGIGLLAGEERIGRIEFEDYHLSYQLGMAALVIIVFDAGLATPLRELPHVLAPAASLATIGFGITTTLIGLAAIPCGFSLTQGLLLGAIVGTTDGGAVLSVLRGTGVHVLERIGLTLELESGLSDSAALLLVIALTRALVEHHRPGAHVAVEIATELAIGAACGLAVGALGRALLRHAARFAGGLLPVLSLAIAFGAFAAGTLVHGNGLLASFLSASVIGSGWLPSRAGLLRVHDAVAWIAQVSMFLLLGILAFPHRLLGVLVPGVALGLALAVARPFAVALTLWPFHYRPREIAYIGWAGLRGALPIILATIPVMAGATDAKRIFDVVFFVVVVSTIIPGSTITWLTRRLGLYHRAAPLAAATLELDSHWRIHESLHSFYLRPAAIVCGATLSQLSLPDRAAVILVVRDGAAIAPHAELTLAAGDHVSVLCRDDDRSIIRLLFGVEVMG
jgi:cell volume regulation protein A